MTLHAQIDFNIPEETVRVAHAAHPRGNTLMKLRDALGTIYQDQTFASLFPHNGRSVETPWVERCGHRMEESRLPKSERDRLALAEQIGEDGRKLLTAVFDSLTPAWLREIPAIQVLRRIWVQNYFVEDERLRWREAENLPPATLFITSPYEPDAHRGKKSTTLWTG